MDDAIVSPAKRSRRIPQRKFGFCSPKALGKSATVGGGPEFRKAGTYPRSPVVYERAELDEWAIAKIGAPCQTTSDYPATPCINAREAGPGVRRRRVALMSGEELNYQAICRLAAATGRTRESLVALKKGNDPFFSPRAACGTPGGSPIAIANRDLAAAFTCAEFMIG